MWIKIIMCFLNNDFVINWYLFVKSACACFCTKKSATRVAPASHISHSAGFSLRFLCFFVSGFFFFFLGGGSDSVKCPF